MELSCQMCGDPFSATRRSAKYCSEKCKKRAQRQPGGTAAVRPAVEAKIRALPGGKAPEEGPRLPQVEGGVTDATRTELEAANRLSTSAGRAALALALRIDESIRETGPGLAKLVSEHRATMAAALENAKKAADSVDEVRARRDKKLGRGG